MKKQIDLTYLYLLTIVCELALARYILLLRLAASKAAVEYEK